jgi:hypothetical protein
VSNTNNIEGLTKSNFRLKRDEGSIKNINKMKKQQT